MQLRAATVRRQARAAAEILPALARQAIEELLAHLRELDTRIEAYDHTVVAIAAKNARIA